MGFRLPELLGSWVQKEEFTDFSYGLSHLTMSNYNILINLRDGLNNPITIPINLLKNANWARIDGDLLGCLLLKLISESQNPSCYYKDPKYSLSNGGHGNSNSRIQFLRFKTFLNFSNNLWLFLTLDFIKTFSHSPISMNNILSYYTLLGQYFLERPDDPLLPIYLLRANHINNLVYSLINRDPPIICNTATKEAMIQSIQSILCSPQDMPHRKFSKLFHTFQRKDKYPYSLSHFQHMNDILAIRIGFIFCSSFNLFHPPNTSYTIQSFINSISNSPLTAKDANAANVFLVEFMQVFHPPASEIQHLYDETSLLGKRLLLALPGSYQTKDKHSSIHWINEIIKDLPPPLSSPSSDTFSLLGPDMAVFVVEALKRFAYSSSILIGSTKYQPTLVNLILSIPNPSGARDYRKLLIKQSTSSRKPASLDLNPLTPTDDPIKTIIRRTVDYASIHDDRMIIKWMTALDYGGPTREWLSRLNEWIMDGQNDILQSYNDSFHRPRPFLHRDIGKLLGITLGKSFLAKIKPLFTIDPAFMAEVILPMGEASMKTVQKWNDIFFSTHFRQLQEFKFYEPLSPYCTEEECQKMYCSSFEEEQYIAKPESITFTSVEGRSNMYWGHCTASATAISFADPSQYFKSDQELQWKDRGSVFERYKQRSLEEFYYFIASFRVALHSILDYSLIERWYRLDSYEHLCRNVLLHSFTAVQEDEGLVKHRLCSSVLWMSGNSRRWKTLFELLITEVLRYEEIVRFLRLLTGLQPQQIEWDNGFQIKIAMKAEEISPLTTLGFVDHDLCDCTIAENEDAEDDGKEEDDNDDKEEENKDLLIDYRRFKEIVEEVNEKLSLRLGADTVEASGGPCRGGKVRLSKYCSCFFQLNLGFCDDELSFLHTFLLSFNQSVDQMHA